MQRRRAFDRIRPVTYILYALSLLPGLSGCVEVAPESGEITPGVRGAQPVIIGGADENGEQGVVLITMELPDGRQANRSGTIVTPTVVLTAVHCVAELSQDGMRIETGIARHVAVYRGDNETARSDVKTPFSTLSKSRPTYNPVWI